MRLGEICRLDPAHFEHQRRFVHLPASAVKNGIARDVPLSNKAVRDIGLLLSSDRHPANANNVSKVFQLAIGRTSIKNLTFHDSRHEAITRLARKLDVLDLARMVGHRNINQLMTYYDATAEEMANRLNSPSDVLQSDQTTS